MAVFCGGITQAQFNLVLKFDLDKATEYYITSVKVMVAV
jgi:hypothetical protein